MHTKPVNPADWNEVAALYRSLDARICKLEFAARSASEGTQRAESSHPGLVERVARAICIASDDSPDLIATMNPNGPHEPLWKTDYEDIAKAAIAAMSHSTPRLIEAAEKLYDAIERAQLSHAVQGEYDAFDEALSQYRSGK